jgi:hypothetical protein
MKSWYIILGILAIGMFLVYNFRKNTLSPTTIIHAVPRQVFVFWTGDNTMSENRKKCYDSIIANIGVKVHLVTPHNLRKYVIKEHPLHEGYQYLCQVHKSDYLRTYFMHHYGGGYTDIKYTRYNWSKYFDEINSKSDIWCIGFPEGENGSSSKDINTRNRYRELIGNSSYIFRSHTKFTEEWYNTLLHKMDEKLDDLRKYPSQYPREYSGSTENGSPSKYPLGWTEILGDHFHDIQIKYTRNTRCSLPPVDTDNYL